MNLLGGKELGRALKQWREARRLRQIDVVKRSKTVSKKPLKPSNLSNMENKGTGLSYKNLVENIFPAYQINDICDYDLFLDYCLAKSVESIAIVRSNERDSQTANPGTKELLIPPDMLKGNRARISIIEIDRDRETVWQNHEGHEYLMIWKGQVTAEFSDSEDGEKKKYKMSEGDGVAFNSAIHHRFINSGDRTAVMIVARPTMSLPKGMYNKER